MCLFYKDDFQLELLRTQLLTFGLDFQRIQREAYGDNDRKPTIFDIKEYFTSLTITAQKSLLSHISRVIKLVLVMPAINATSEGSSSALRRVKSYLRSTMSQQRLNNPMLLHVHKGITDIINWKDIASEFIGNSEHRLKIFGKF